MVRPVQLIKSKRCVGNERTMNGQIAIMFMVIAVCAVLVLAGHEFVKYLEMLLDLQHLAREHMLAHPAIIAVFVLYIVLLAIPLVPGAEIGILLFIVFGAEVAGLVYLATLCAMTLSFAIGRLIPTPLLRHAFVTFGLTHVADALTTNTDHAASLDRVYEGSNPWVARLVRYRCVSLAVLINTPGNAVIGGGGGIAMAAGISRLFSFRQFLLSVSIAVAPVPLTVLVAAWLSA